jgi:DNA repair protein RadC
MHLQLNDSSVPCEPGDVLTGVREANIVESLSTLVGADRAEQLLRRVGPVGLEHMDADEIAASAGVPHRTADLIVAARTLTNTVRERKLPRGSRPEHLVSALPADFALYEREVLFGIALTGTNRVKAIVVLAAGGTSGAAVLTRDVLMPMVRHAASGFALAHNHPSGDKAPSREDVLLTNAVARAAAILHMPLVDHIVVARSGFTSFDEAGLMLTDDELAGQSDALKAAGVR